MYIYLSICFFGSHLAKQVWYPSSIGKLELLWLVFNSTLLLIQACHFSMGNPDTNPKNFIASNSSNLPVFGQILENPQKLEEQNPWVWYNWHDKHVKLTINATFFNIPSPVPSWSEKRVSLLEYVGGYDPYIGGVKPSFFMVPGSKGIIHNIHLNNYCKWTCCISIWVHLEKPFHLPYYLFPYQVALASPNFWHSADSYLPSNQEKPNITTHYYYVQRNMYFCFLYICLM